VNCDSVHRRLHALERLDRPPADLRQHLNACAVCRTLHEQLMLLECEVPQLPVPAPTRKAAFLEKLAREAPSPTFAPRLLRPSGDSRRERALKKLALAVGLAATLLVAAFVAWIVNQDRSPSQHDQITAEPRKTPLDELKSRDIRWARAKTPVERVRLLDEWANETEGKALALADRSDELEKQLQLYTEVINALIDTEAPQMSAQERKEQLKPIAGRMAMVQSEAKRLAMALSPEAAEKLLVLAQLAGDGDRRLRAML
jgi:hypothetical protein